LVDSGANIHCEDNRGLTVLHLAAESGDESVVEYLLSKGCEIDSQDLHGRTALHCITILNSYYRDDSDRDDWSLNMYQETARTKRHPSTRIRKECVFGFLIERGANLELSDNDGNTPLLLAARVSHPGIIQTLLFHGADNNAQNNLLHTALHWAAGRDDEAMIDVLLSHGASHRALDHQQFTPLHWAAYTGSEAAAKLLIKAGA
ncbi:ankyrin, partial [Morchella conica CCBAS932]